MLTSIVLGLITLVFIGLAAFLFIGLLSINFGIDMFSPFDKMAWKTEPFVNIIKTLILVVVLLFIFAASYFALIGEPPFGKIPDSEQWEPG